MKIFENNFWLGQLFGSLAFVALWFSFQENRKDNLLKYQIYSSCFYALQYLCIGAYTGFFLNFMCLIRNFIYHHYQNKKIPLKWLIICVGWMVFLSLLSYDGFKSLLPMIGVVLNSWGFWQSKIRVSRFCNLVANLLVVLYNALVGAWGAFLATIFEIFMVCIAIYRFDFRKEVE